MPALSLPTFPLDADRLPADMAERLSRVRHVITDTDNTMVSHGRALCSTDGTPSVELAQTLIDLTDAGVDVVPCTGRNRAMIREDVRLLGLSGWIGEMGGVLCLHEGADSDWRYFTADMPFDESCGKTPHDVIWETGVVDRLLERWYDCLETYNDNNIDGLNYTVGYSTRTGYYMRKLLRPDVNLNPSNTTNQKSYDARIRWTEMFLDYAEAANEAVGPEAAVAGSKWTAKSVIKSLRERAGICAGVDDPYLDECAQSKEKMRELIRNERRLELCFENHRFYDLRRWQVDLNKLNETVTGAEISAPNAGFKTIDVEQRSYKQHQFFGPIPYSEILKYDALQQNSGW